MLIDVRRCLAHNRFEGDFEFPLPCEQAMIEIPYAEFASPVRVRGTFHILEDDSLEVEGEIGYTLKGLCSRCLNETETDVSYAFHEYFVLRDNGEDYLLKNGCADLTEVARDAVLLSMPRALLCRRKCEMIPYHS